MSSAVSFPLTPLETDFNDAIHTALSTLECDFDTSSSRTVTARRQPTALEIVKEKYGIGKRFFSLGSSRRLSFGNLDGNDSPVEAGFGGQIPKQSTPAPAPKPRKRRGPQKNPRKRKDPIPSPPPRQMTQEEYERKWEYLGAPAIGKSQALYDREQRTAKEKERQQLAQARQYTSPPQRQAFIQQHTNTGYGNRLTGGYQTQPPIPNYCQPQVHQHPNSPQQRPYQSAPPAQQQQFLPYHNTQYHVSATPPLHCPQPQKKISPPRTPQQQMLPVPTPTPAAPRQPSRPSNRQFSAAGPTGIQKRTASSSVSTQDHRRLPSAALQRSQALGRALDSGLPMFNDNTAGPAQPLPELQPSHINNGMLQQCLAPLPLPRPAPVPAAHRLPPPGVPFKLSESAELAMGRHFQSHGYWPPVNAAYIQEYGPCYFFCRNDGRFEIQMELPDIPELLPEVLPAVPEVLPAVLPELPEAVPEELPEPVTQPRNNFDDILDLLDQESLLNGDSPPLTAAPEASSSPAAVIPALPEPKVTGLPFNNGLDFSDMTPDLHPTAATPQVDFQAPGEVSTEVATEEQVIPTPAIGQVDGEVDSNINSASEEASGDAQEPSFEDSGEQQLTFHESIEEFMRGFFGFAAGGEELFPGMY